MSIHALNRESRDPVAGGFYTVDEAARLLRISKPATLAAWLKGRGARGEPVVRRQYEPIGKIQELGFLDLIEVRFIDHFRKMGYSLQSLRKAAETARKELHCEHPFALYGIKFVAERKNIFLKVASDIRDTKLLNLVTKQYAMYEVLEDVLSRAITFDPTSGLATRWRPDEKSFPRVVVDPIVAYGQPAVEPSRVPTDAIFATWQAEGGNFNAVADWYEIELSAAQEGVEFEMAFLA